MFVTLTIMSEELQAIHEMAELVTDDDVSSSGIYRIKGVSDVFAGRVEHGIVKPGECPGDNVDFNIKGLDKNNMARSEDEMVYKKEAPKERIREKIVVTAPQITEEVVEVKEMITDLMNRVQFTDDADLMRLER